MKKSLAHLVNREPVGTWELAPRRENARNGEGCTSKIFYAFGKAAVVAAALACASAGWASGPVVGWGWNGDPGDEWGQATPPRSVDGTTGTATAIAAGGYHSCAIRAGSGAVVCWGRGWSGQTTPPDSVNGVSGTASSIAAGYLHTCAIQAGSGAVVCWGLDGHGETVPPDSVNGASGTASVIAAGHYLTCAIQAGSGAVVCWGFDPDGQLLPPTTVNGTAGTASAIAAGDGHICAIQAGSGVVVCWGFEQYGQRTPPPAVNGIAGTASAIAAGGQHSCAIQAGSRAVVCWGADHFDEATPPDSVNGVSGRASAIAAGVYHSCAIQAGSGAVVCWGSDLSGELTPPTSMDGASFVATAIAAGGAHSLAIRQPTPLRRGDLVVTDHFGGRVVRVDSAGAAETFSPPPGGTNLLVNPAGIVAAPDGHVYVVDTSTDRLIRLDRRTGAQTIVREPDLDPFGDPSPTSVGDQPWGLDAFEDVLGMQRFYVSAGEGLRAATEQLLVGGFVGSLVDGTLPVSHFGVAVRSDGPTLDSVWIAAGPNGLWSWDASDDTAAQVIPSASGDWFLDVDFGGMALGLPVFTRVEMAGFGGCAAGTGGVFSAYGGVLALSQGGLFRCPFSLAFVPEQDEIYVADAATLVNGGEGRVVRLRQSGFTWEQSLFVDAATLGVSFPAGIAYVPEPDGTALGGIALAALAAAGRRLRRVGRVRTPTTTRDRWTSTSAGS